MATPLPGSIVQHGKIIIARLSRGFSTRWLKTRVYNNFPVMHDACACMRVCIFVRAGACTELLLQPLQFSARTNVRLHYKIFLWTRCLLSELLSSLAFSTLRPHVIFLLMLVHCTQDFFVDKIYEQNIIIIFIITFIITFWCCVSVCACHFAVKPHQTAASFAHQVFRHAQCK